MFSNISNYKVNPYKNENMVMGGFFRNEICGTKMCNHENANEMSLKSLTKYYVFKTNQIIR